MLKDLENKIIELITELKPAPSPDETGDLDAIYFDCTELDNSRWLALMQEHIKTAKAFEIHCWNEETEWIELALRYGTLKRDEWQYGKIITGAVTPEFTDMLLHMPKPADLEICNKMTPFFNVFLDDSFQSCHYGTELYL